MTRHTIVCHHYTRPNQLFPNCCCCCNFLQVFFSSSDIFCKLAIRYYLYQVNNVLNRYWPNRYRSQSPCLQITMYKYYLIIFFLSLIIVVVTGAQTKIRNTGQFNIVKYVNRLTLFNYGIIIYLYDDIQNQIYVILFNNLLNIINFSFFAHEDLLWQFRCILHCQ